VLSILSFTQRGYSRNHGSGVSGPPIARRTLVGWYFSNVLIARHGFAAFTASRQLSSCLTVLPKPLVLTFFVYEEAHRRALKRARLEFAALRESVTAGAFPTRRLPSYHNRGSAPSIQRA